MLQWHLQNRVSQTYVLLCFRKFCSIAIRRSSCSPELSLLCQSCPPSSQIPDEFHLSHPLSPSYREECLLLKGYTDFFIFFFIYCTMKPAAYRKPYVSSRVIICFSALAALWTSSLNNLSPKMERQAFRSMTCSSVMPKLFDTSVMFLQ